MSKLRELTQEEAYERINELAPAFYQKRKKDLRVSFLLMMVLLTAFMAAVNLFEDAPIVLALLMFVCLVPIMRCVAYLADCLFFKKMMAGKVPMVDPVEERDWVVSLAKMKQPVMVEVEEEV